MIVALAQLSSTRDLAQNLDTCATLTRQAAARGAQWVLFPENAPFLGKDREKLGVAEPIGGPITCAFQEMAREHRCYISVGSIPERSPSPDHTYNTQLLIDPAGHLLAAYRKLHLFEVALPDGTALREADSMLPGEEIVSAQLRGDGHQWEVGLSICYDLRFPELYRALTARGAHVLTVPSAFTLQTGPPHWHALLRARAIENQTYVLAPNQWGHHFDRRASYGQSVIYDPWGNMLASAPDRTCVITAELNMEFVRQVRRQIPCGQHLHPLLLRGPGAGAFT